MGVIEDATELVGLIKRVGDADLYRRIVKLEGEVIDLTRDKRLAQERIAELERTLKFRDELEFREPFFWAKGDTVPYCPRCWEEKRIAVHITYSHKNSYGEYWDCKSCGANFQTRGLSNKHY
jgi:hypothetical protein